MWIRIREIKLPAGAAANPEEERELLLRKICKILRIERGLAGGISIYRKSPDLRKKAEPLFVYTVDAEFFCSLKQADSAHFTVIAKPENAFDAYIERIRDKSAASGRGGPRPLWSALARRGCLPASFWRKRDAGPLSWNGDDA